MVISMHYHLSNSKQRVDRCDYGYDKGVCQNVRTRRSGFYSSNRSIIFNFQLASNGAS
ncbi:hypothetical protein D1AOALGA4SA_3758 [Olavius algarvensis Delta 1 endosymbiont]|nr:hypothetical protein D1AOALGA4SA_3758 [Olavius algarvensis Delta 1 endosymbiont]